MLLYYVTYDPGCYFLIFENFRSQIIYDVVIVCKYILIPYISCMVSLSINVNCSIYLLQAKKMYVSFLLLRDNSEIPFELRGTYGFQLEVQHVMYIYLFVYATIFSDITFTSAILNELIILRANLTWFIYIYIYAIYFYFIQICTDDYFDYNFFCRGKEFLIS